MKNDQKDEYFAFQEKLIRRVWINVATSIAIVVGLYLLIWKQRVGDWIVWLLENVFQINHEQSTTLSNNIIDITRISEYIRELSRSQTVYGVNGNL